MSANSENGVLVIELPKKAAAQPKQIKINVGPPRIEASQTEAPQQQAA